MPVRGVLTALSVVAGVMVVGADPVRAQTVFADCAALDGHVFNREHNSAIISETNTITTLNDGDALSFDIRFNSGDSGLISGVITIDGTTVFSETIQFGGVGGVALGTYDRTASYDPPADGSDVTLAFTTLPFTSDEGLVRFTVGCVPGPATGTPSTPTTPVTGAATQLFATERVRRILESRPDRPRYLRKRLRALWGNEDEPDTAADADTQDVADALTRNRLNKRAGAGQTGSQRSAAVPAQSAPIPTPVQVASTRPMLVGMAARDATLKAFAYQGAINDGCGESSAAVPKLHCVDVWTEAHYTRFTDKADRDGHFGVVYAGADWHLTPWAIAGLMGQVDWMVDEAGRVRTKTEGIGFMVGPYASMRLTPRLFFDVRAAWGLSDTDVNADGITGNVATERWLVTAQLSGNFHAGDYRITPEVAVEYIEEELDAYTTSNGAVVGKQKVTIGRLRFGPEVARRYDLGDGDILEPRLSVQAAWDFNPADTVTLGNVRYGDDDFRAIVEAGTILKTASGINFAISGKYEGIGVEGFDAYGGYFWINAPI